MLKQTHWDCFCGNISPSAYNQDEYAIRHRCHVRDLHSASRVEHRRIKLAQIIRRRKFNNRNISPCPKQGFIFLLVNEYQIIVPDEDVVELINKDEHFKIFAKQCIEHFTHFVIPRRDQDNEIAQDYEIPDSVDYALAAMIMLTRKDKSNKIYISFWNWM